MSSRTLAITLLIMGANTACSNRDLRGYQVPSSDGLTYLVVEDDNGGKCGEIKLDGEKWQAPLRQPGQISPGEHRLSCGEGHGVAFEVAEGTTFHFDYWGP